MINRIITYDVISKDGSKTFKGKFEFYDFYGLKYGTKEYQKRTDKTRKSYDRVMKYLLKNKNIFNINSYDCNFDERSDE